MKSLLLTIGYVWYLLAPLPPGIAINPETKECGSYFGGDEYGGYVLSSPWEVTYNPTIQTDSGTIQWEGSVEEYCQRIGYTHIPGNLGEIYGKNRKSIVFYIVVMGIIAPFILILAVILIGYSLYLKRMRKRKKVLIRKK